MDTTHGSHGSFPHEGPWLGKAGIAAAGLMIGVVVGMVVSPWTAPPAPQLETLASQAASPAMPALVAPMEQAGQGAAAAGAVVPAVASEMVQGMELCWGGDEPVRC